MTIEEAILTAIDYENEVRDVYKIAAEVVTDPTGKRVCSVMADEEQNHVDYLESRLAEWRKTGKVNPEVLETAMPPRKRIDEVAGTLTTGMGDTKRGTEMEMLGKALDAERKTSSYYRKLVAELPPEGQELFKRFVEIEDGHLAMVQAQIDSLTGTGAWFDVLEIRL